MVEFKLSSPDDFNEYEREVESKGWFSDAVLVIEGQRFRLNFYDLARLTQEVGDELSRSAASDRVSDTPGRRISGRKRKADVTDS